MAYEKALELLAEGGRIQDCAAKNWPMVPDYFIDDDRADRQIFLRLVKRMEIKREDFAGNNWIITDKGRERAASLKPIHAN